MKAPTDDLSRQASFTVVRADEDDDGFTLEGYGAVFGQPTLIDSWEGRFEELIDRGAFRKTIKDKGPRGVRLQFDHGGHPLIGSLPIGTIQTLAEDSRGLKVVARLHDNWLIQPVRDAIRDGSVTGMSFRFRVVREEWDDTVPDLPVRTLKEIELYEVGPVVWPAYEQTSVGVRAQQIARELMDPEQRSAVARALLAGTPTEAAPTEPEEIVVEDDGEIVRDRLGTSDEAAAPDGPPEGTRETTEPPRRAERPRTLQEDRREVARKIREAALRAKEQADA